MCSLLLIQQYPVNTTYNSSVRLNCNTVDEMVDILTENINLALDEVAPYKTFTVKSNYKFGISPETKKLMKQRDNTREKIKYADNSEKVLLLAKYKRLRNLVNRSGSGGSTKMLQ